MTERELASQAKAAADLRESFASLRELSRDVTADLARGMRASTNEIRSADREAKSLARSMSSGLRRAFDQAIFGGAKLSTVMKGLALDMSRTVLNSALAPVQSAVGSGVSSLVSGGLTSLFSGLFAKGAAFSSGRVRAFAKGGVVSGPTTFPMRGGTGLMGEAGPEAIMPLTRGPDGKLGVRAESQARAGQVVVNISTPDVESFRRSQGQIAAGLARAVARGRRNL